MVGQGKKDFANCSHLVGDYIDCFQTLGYLEVACVGRAGRGGHGDGWVAQKTGTVVHMSRVMAHFAVHRVVPRMRAN